MLTICSLSGESSDSPRGNRQAYGLSTGVKLIEFNPVWLEGLKEFVLEVVGEALAETATLSVGTPPAEIEKLPLHPKVFLPWADLAMLLKEERKREAPADRPDKAYYRNKLTEWIIALEQNRLEIEKH